MFSKLLFATLAGAVVLFLWDGLMQALPGVGVRAVQTTEASALLPEIAAAPGMTYVTTPESVSFVSTQPAGYYDVTRFFVIEAVSALVVSVLLAALFTTVRLSSRSKMLLVASIAGAAASAAIHIPYWNWWGFSIAYTAGVIAKTVFGWMAVALVQSRFIRLR